MAEQSEEGAQRDSSARILLLKQIETGRAGGRRGAWSSGGPVTGSPGNC